MIRVSWFGPITSKDTCRFTFSGSLDAETDQGKGQGFELRPEGFHQLAGGQGSLGFRDQPDSQTRVIFVDAGWKRL